MSIANFAEDAIIDALFNNTALAVAATHLQLHTGDPGEDGTDNVATEDTRQPATWTPSSGGETSLEDDVTWLNVAATETYTHVSVWDAATDGNCIWGAELEDPVDINAGNSFTLNAGELSFSID